MPDDEPRCSPEAAETDPARPCRNMHENVEVWEDICVCEAEPRWQELGEAMAGNDATRTRGDAGARREEKSSQDNDAPARFD